MFFIETVIHTEHIWTVKLNFDIENKYNYLSSTWNKIMQYYDPAEKYK